MEHVSIYNPTNLSLTNNLYKEKKSKKIIAVSNACPNNPWNYISFFLLFLVLSVVWAQFFLTFMAACSIHYASARISDDSSMGFLCCQQHLSDSLMRAAKASEESSSLLHRPWRPRKEGGHGRSWLHPRRRRPVSPGKSGGRDMDRWSDGRIDQPAGRNFWWRRRGDLTRRRRPSGHLSRERDRPQLSSLIVAPCTVALEYLGLHYWIAA